MVTVRLNSRLRGFACIRCERNYPLGDYPEGCRACLDAGFPASVTPIFAAPDGGGKLWGKGGPGRFADRMPYDRWPCLGEGDTPLVSLDRLAAEFGLEKLLVKCEFANPTGSHKDRMSAQFIARAMDRGAPTVAAASSGNAGASVAAYAAAAGIPCVIVTTSAMDPVWRQAIEMTGAQIDVVDNALARWRYIREKVATEGWLSATNHLAPPVGSEPFGVEGYKALGLELALDERCADADAIFVPTARGDVLWGIYKGYRELLDERAVDRMPALVAVEPFPRLEKVLAGADYRGEFEGKTKLSSIAGSTLTLQSLLPIEATGGTAVATNDVEVIADRRRLAANGLYLELSAAAAFTGMRLLQQAGRFAFRKPVLIATSHGYKGG